MEDPARVKDDLFSAIQRVAAAAHNSWSKPEIEGSRKWTIEIKAALATLGRNYGYTTCCSGVSNGLSNWGEWLYDLCWLTPSGPDGLYSAMPLAMECEWGISQDEILPDFQKLVFSKANVCLMIWQNLSNDDLMRDAQFLRQQIKIAGDTESRYLLIGYDNEKHEFVRQ